MSARPTMAKGLDSLLDLMLEVATRNDATILAVRGAMHGAADDRDWAAVERLAEDAGERIAALHRRIDALAVAPPAGARAVDGTLADRLDAALAGGDEKGPEDDTSAVDDIAALAAIDFEPWSMPAISVKDSQVVAEHVATFQLALEVMAKSKGELVERFAATPAEPIATAANLSALERLAQAEAQVARLSAASAFFREAAATCFAAEGRIMVARAAALTATAVRAKAA